MNSDKIDRMLKTLAPLAACVCLGVVGVSVSGCNTIEGAGKDIESGGDAIEDAASDAND